MANYYIDGSTLQNSTAVYQDSGLTQCAPAAFYSDGLITREQVFAGSNCSLLPAQVCPSCSTPCGGSISGSGGQGIFTLDIDLGGTASDTGAVILTFNPQGIPDGISVTYDGTVYNKLSSPVFGLLQSSAVGTETYVGNTASQGQCGGGNTGSVEGTYILPVSDYNGSGFTPTGTSETITITAAQNALTAGRPEDCIMVIPKPNATPTVMNIRAIGPCGSTAWSLSAVCPTPLPSMLAGIGNFDTVCTSLLNTTVYHVPVNGQADLNVQVNDYIFTDINGVTPASNSWYLHPTGYKYEVQDGIVITVSNTCDTITVSDCKGGGNYTFNDRFNTNTSGEVIQYKRVNLVNQTIPTTTYCGTITGTGQGTSTNAQQEGFIDRACDDTTHCP